MVRVLYQDLGDSKFKKNLLEVLHDNYSFYVLKQKESGKKLSQVINENYKALNGKIISYNGEDCVYLALSNQEKDAISGTIAENNFDILLAIIDDLDIYEYDVRDKSIGKRVTLKLENIEEDSLVKSIVDDCQYVLEAIRNVQVTLNEEGIYEYAKMEAGDWHRIITKYFNERNANFRYPNTNQMEIVFPPVQNVAEDSPTGDE